MMEFLASATDDISKKLMYRMNVIERLLLLSNVKSEKIAPEKPARSRSPRGNSNSSDPLLASAEIESTRSRSPRRRPEGPLANQTFSVRVQCSRLARL